ncbi:MAG: hydrogenase maturation protease [Candidatus Cloacimonetes bacterium]|nr:hydrogenase maturation protease [Candidatus Cloacimonadota bacterium]
MKTLVLGLGNTILSDDGVGIHIARHIKEKLPEIDMIEASAAGFRVVDEIIGYDKLILIDSIKTKNGQPGTYYKLGIEEFKSTLHHSSPHDMNMFDALQLMKKHNADLPKEIIIYAIEVEDTFTFSEQCTEKVAEVIPEITSIIIRDQFPSSKI